MKRKIPIVMATQHPDNAKIPFWGKKAFISTHDEIEECFQVFSELGVDEYMWDWEGKFVDEAVIDRLLNQYYTYFKQNELGKEKFLTFRIPNFWKEKGQRVARAFMAIISAAHIATEYDIHSPPLFEVILPMTTHANQLISILKKFHQALGFEKAIFDKGIFPEKALEMIPLIEGSATLLDSKKILRQYVKDYKILFGKKPSYLRPFIARSDPALDAGFIAATLSARGAISEYYHFAKEVKIPVYPILGCGGGHFRGGISPINLDRFFSLYAGIRTVTLQSAFIYDHPISIVKKGIAKIKNEMPKLAPTLFSDPEILEITELANHFAEHYRPVVEALANEINDLSKYTPKHRERIPHTGHFGYSRKMGKSNISLPRAITFAAVFQSLGIPAMFIGSGRGLSKLINTGQINKLEKYIPDYQKDFVAAGYFLNKENLDILAKNNPAWKMIEQDILVIEQLLGKKLGPARSEHFIHRNITSNILHYWKQGKYEEVSEEILHAAYIRRYLG